MFTKVNNRVTLLFCCRFHGVSTIMEKKVKGEQHEEKETKTNAKTIANESTKERISYIR